MLIIRPYQAQDAAGVEQCLIELQSFERSIEPNRVEGQRMVVPYREHLLAECAQTRGVLLVAEVAGMVVGLVAVLARVTSESLIEAEPDYAYISDLVVLPAYRGQGLGRALLQQAETYALSQGATLLKVDVLVANKAAHQLYKTTGFQENEVRLVKRLSHQSSE